MKNSSNVSTVLTSSDGKSTYDKEAKKLLSDKQILARILKGAVPELNKLSVAEIMRCLDESVIEISKIAEPGLTNSETIESVQTEDSVLNEGYIYFDIRFPLVYPEGRKYIKIIVNVEAQKKVDASDLGYHLENRIQYYLARLISSQKTVEFTNDDYDKIKKVYSIWICFGAESDTETIQRFSFGRNVLWGSKENKFKQFNKMNALIVYLSLDFGEHDWDNSVIHLLKTLFGDIKLEVRKQILEEKHGVAMSYEMERRLRDMCNLSELIIEKGIEQEKLRTAERMLKNGADVNSVHLATELSIQQIEELKRKLGFFQSASCKQSNSF